MTFGVSFENDDHVLDTLLENESLKAIYFGCYGSRDGIEFFKLQARIVESCSRIKRDLASLQSRVFFFNSSCDPFGGDVLSPETTVRLFGAEVVPHM